MVAKIIVSGMELEIAEVVWFNPQKLFGFATRIKTGKEIFFHSNDERHVALDSEIENLIFKDPTHRCTSLKKGDFIFFVEAPGSKGRPKASPWIEHFNYLNIATELEVLNMPCKKCGHLMKFHDDCDNICRSLGCHCGEEYWEEDYTFIKLPNGKVEAILNNYTETNLGDDAGGLRVYE